MQTNRYDHKHLTHLSTTRSIAFPPRSLKTHRNSPKKNIAFSPRSLKTHRNRPKTNIHPSASRLSLSDETPFLTSKPLRKVTTPAHSQTETLKFGALLNRFSTLKGKEAAEVYTDLEKTVTESDGEFTLSDSGDSESVTVTLEVKIGNEVCSGSVDSGVTSESSEGSSDLRGRISPGMLDRTLHRSNTLPVENVNIDKSEASSSPPNLERSKTERRRHHYLRGGEAAQIFDDKISDRKKIKMLNRIATVHKDGTVEVELPESVPPRNLHLGPEDDSSKVVIEEAVDWAHIEYIPPLQIVMLIVGTRGDVQPFVAIGKRLQDFGHRVRLATHSNFKDFVLTAGLEFFQLGGDPKVLAEYMVKNKGFLPSGPSEIAIQRKQIKEIIYSLLPACRDADPESGVPFHVQAIIANPPAYGHTHVAEALKVPLHIFFTMPWTPTSEFPHPLSRVKPPAAYRLSYQIVDSLIWLGMQDIINDFRKKKLKLRPVTYLSSSHGSPDDVPTGYMWSPHLVPKPKDWGPKIDVVGFCFLDLASSYEPPESLVKWIKAGEKPIYIGFGSLPVQEPAKMTQIIVEALERTGQRGIINKGWGGLGNLAEPKDFVYLLDNCPHDWLFLHCKAVVHHGGAGTTAAGLRAACPTTVVPFFGDQPFWGDRVHARGVGPPPIPIDDFSLEKLVHAIYFMLDPKVKDRAEKLAKAMESEDGVGGAVNAFYKHFPRNWPRPQSQPQPEPHPQPLPLPSVFCEPCLGSLKKCFGRQ